MVGVDLGLGLGRGQHLGQAQGQVQGLAGTVRLYESPHKDRSPRMRVCPGLIR